MSLLLHIAAACGFLFLFFFSSEYVDDSSSFVYLEYMCLIVVFIIILRGIQVYIEENGKKDKRSRSKKAQDEHKEMVRNMFSNRKKRSRNHMRRPLGK